MHELGIVFHMIDTLEELGEENSLSSIGRVTLRLGEVSGVLPDYLTDCWNWARDKHDLTRGAALELEEVPAVSACNDCGERYATVEHGIPCPACGSTNTVLVQGNELEIKEIEAC